MILSLRGADAPLSRRVFGEKLTVGPRLAATGKDLLYLTPNNPTRHVPHSQWFPIELFKRNAEATERTCGLLQGASRPGAGGPSRPSSGSRVGDVGDCGPGPPDPPQHHQNPAVQPGRYSQRPVGRSVGPEPRGSAERTQSLSDLPEKRSASNSRSASR
ncbi:hypothetical protein NHX12_025272 [Muraenolepis orangiensis]|uniref:Uncharacterized protein n=1 Tax=Muraenolepis orangiensis TaxID=630683 RepID=A0A9Q0EPK7_9TELE|nr:hypothetical protein NHX12_025272 [Muraenolepis orangiensis]